MRSASELSVLPCERRRAARRCASGRRHGHRSRSRPLTVRVRVDRFLQALIVGGSRHLVRLVLPWMARTRRPGTPLPVEKLRSRFRSSQTGSRPTAQGDRSAAKKQQGSKQRRVNSQVQPLVVRRTKPSPRSGEPTATLRADQRSHHALRASRLLTVVAVCDPAAERRLRGGDRTRPRFRSSSGRDSYFGTYERHVQELGSQKPSLDGHPALA